MKVVIIGSGNVATVLSRKVLSAGHEIRQVIGRDKDHAATLADELKCSHTSTFDDIYRDADLYILAVSDSSLSEISNKLFLDKKLIAHTAGSVSKNVLKNTSKNYGVLYPLQSLRKEIKAIPEMPLLIDANTKDNLVLLYNFAKTISDKVQIADDEERLKLHVAAIIVNNFTNHLYALTDDYCKKEHLDFKLLTPLIKETSSRISSFSPGKIQTGPAARNDTETIQKHLELLSQNLSLKKIYEVMSESIIEHVGF